MVCHFLISATFQLMILYLNETNNKQIGSNNLYVYMCVQCLHSLIHGYDELQNIKIIYIYVYIYIYKKGLHSLSNWK